MHHLPVLQVVIPLMSAPLCVVLRRRNIAWGIALVVSWISFIISLLILVQAMDIGTTTYFLGNWAAPWGIEYRIDVLNAFILVIIGAIGTTVITYAKKSVEYEILNSHHYLFYTGYLLCLTGLFGITATGDLFNIFVFLEISSLASYLLIALGHRRQALTATYRYLVMGTVGAVFYFVGIGMLYMMTGTLNMADLAERLPAVVGSRTILAALGFLTVGLCLKAAVFPLHQWMPNVYTYAPSTVTAFLAATATKVSIYVFLRIFFTVFGATDILKTLPIGNILLVMAVLGMLTGSFTAIYQKDVKRALAFSSIAQVGYIILGVGLLSINGITAGIIHLFNHALMKCALFLALGCIVLRVHSSDIDDIAGIAHQMPWVMAAFVVSGLSLIGVPATVGFISKWMLVQAAFEEGGWLLALLILTSSLLTIIYIWRIIEIAYFREPREDCKAIKEAPISMLVPLWVMTGMVVYFGIDATYILKIAGSAAKLLMGEIP